jgi:hypothetical protein
MTVMGSVRQAVQVAAFSLFAPQTTEIVDLVEASFPREAADKYTPIKASEDARNKTKETLRKNTRYVVVAPTFKLVFLTVTVVTVVCGAMEVVLATLWEHPTANQQSAFEAIGFAWKAGIGAIFGLLGGKIR